MLPHNSGFTGRVEILRLGLSIDEVGTKPTRRGGKSRMANPTEESGPPIHDHLRYIAKLQKNYIFFSEMQDNEIYQFLRMCPRLTFDEGETIFSEGDEADNFYLILSGEVIIRAGGHEFSRLGSGKIFGEMGILEHVPRNATAQVAKKAEVFSVEQNVLATQVPSLGFNIACNLALQLSTKLREADEQLKKLPSDG